MLRTLSHSMRLLLLFVALTSVAALGPAKTCSTGVAEEDPAQDVNGADSARLGFQFMKEAQRNPAMMQDVMKDLQDPETMEKVQEMMQDPNFRAEVERMKAQMMQNPEMQRHMEMLKNNPEYMRQMQDKAMRQMEASGMSEAEIRQAMAGMGGMGGAGAGMGGMGRGGSGRFV